ncbi:MAG: SulP family inorganic anion transporter [Terrimicrobiaceae bacterium]|nr:SulP family inorganic anion transporter [Terrimicrobiaceae bacterium]
MRPDLSRAPRLFAALRDYSPAKFGADLTAGLTLGVIALPLAMAFGIASGVTPEQGIYTGIVAGFLISFFGGTRLCIGGPTGAFVVIVYGIVQTYGFEKLVICTMIAGVLLVVMGLLKVGTLIKFIPYPVTTGFTSGIAVIILLSQVKDFLGVEAGALPVPFFDKISVLWSALPTLDVVTFALAAVSLVILRTWSRLPFRRIPAAIVVLVLGTAAVAIFQLPVATIGSQFGGIPSGLPGFRWPAWSLETATEMFQPAITIALLAAIESLLCAVVADGVTGDRHNANTELVGQGIANFVTPLFGGIPATGAIARTVANIQAGGVSPVSGIIHAMTLLGIVLVAAPLARFVPLAVLSAILVAVALRMGEWREFLRLGRIPRADAAVFLATFLLTIVFDLTVAVEIGMLLAAMLFIKRVTDTTVVSRVTDDNEDEGDQHSIAGKDIPDGVTIYRIAGPFLFGAADKLEDALLAANSRPRVVILRMRSVTSMDATALNALEMLVSKIRANGGHVIICGAHTQPFFMMTQAGFLDDLGNDHIARDVDEALAMARRILAGTS